MRPGKLKKNEKKKLEFGQNKIKMDLLLCRAKHFPILFKETNLVLTGSYLVHE